LPAAWSPISMGRAPRKRRGRGAAATAVATVRDTGRGRALARAAAVSGPFRSVFALSRGFLSASTGPVSAGRACCRCADVRSRALTPVPSAHLARLLEAHGGCGSAIGGQLGVVIREVGVRRLRPVEHSYLWPAPSDWHFLAAPAEDVAAPALDAVAGGWFLEANAPGQATRIVDQDSRVSQPS
jgi:hypothetical protein